jgi:hypothetical protein
MMTRRGILAALCCSPLSLLGFKPRTPPLTVKFAKGCAVVNGTAEDKLAFHESWQTKLWPDWKNCLGQSRFKHLNQEVAGIREVVSEGGSIRFCARAKHSMDAIQYAISQCGATIIATIVLVGVLCLSVEAGSKSKSVVKTSSVEASNAPDSEFSSQTIVRSGGSAGVSSRSYASVRSGGSAGASSRASKSKHRSSSRSRSVGSAYSASGCSCGAAGCSCGR